MKNHSLLVIALLVFAGFKTSQHVTPNSKGSPVVHFEIGCKDLKKTTEFYTKTFGWSSADAEMSSTISTQSAEGIQGHITSLGHEPNNYVTFYIQVEDIKASLEEIEKAGGKKIVGPIPLPDKSQFAWFRDPEGNVVGLLSR
jgi:predicted enzyme related to lactoylglutathione lyase